MWFEVWFVGGFVHCWVPGGLVGACGGVLGCYGVLGMVLLSGQDLGYRSLVSGCVCSVCL